MSSRKIPFDELKTIISSASMDSGGFEDIEMAMEYLFKLGFLNEDRIDFKSKDDKNEEE